MAENKKGFLLYADHIHTVRKLSDAQAGILFKTILAFVNDELGVNPSIADPLTDMAFEPIKLQLKRDLKRYEKIIENRSLAGKASAALRARLKVEGTPSPIAGGSEQQNPVSGQSNNLIDFYFKDLPNSTAFENVIRALEPDFKKRADLKTKLLKYLPDFRKSASLSYPNMLKFAEHFKNWYLKLDKTGAAGENSKQLPGTFGKKK